jgi:hypothetical protein
VVNGTTSYSAAYYAQQASGSASTATTEAGTATTQATAAASSASAASTSQTAAAGSATAAASSASAAAASATASANSASTFNGITSVAVTSTTQTLSTATFANGMIVFTGALTGNTVITVPATAHPFIAINNTTGQYSLTFAMTGGSNSIAVPLGKAGSLYCDGSTGVYGASSSTSGLQFAKYTEVTTSTVLDVTYAGSIVVAKTAGITITLPVGTTYAAGSGLAVLNYSGGSVTIAVQGSDKTDEGTSFTTSNYDYTFLISTGLSAASSSSSINWKVVDYSNWNSPTYSNVNVKASGQVVLGSGGSIKFGDGTVQSTANGTTGPTSTLYTPASGTTQITTGGYNVGFVQVYQNGVRLVPGSDFTATDGTHVNLTTATRAGDTVEVLTQVVYTPSSITTPSSVLYTPAAGATSISVSPYTVGYCDVYMNGSRLVKGQDYTATDGATVQFSGFTATGTDTFEVVEYSPTTISNTVSQAAMQANTYLYTVDTGAANAYVANYSPAIGVLTDGMMLEFSAVHANSSASSLTVNGLGPYPIYGNAHSALTGGEIIAGGRVEVMWNASLLSWILLENTGGAVQLAPGTGALHAVNMSQLTGRNRIINGACQVAQRASFVASASTSGYGGPDRFSCNNASTGQFTQSQGTITINGVAKSAVVQTVNTAVGSITGGNIWQGIIQNIEGLNCYDLLGQQVTVSFWFNTNVTGTYSFSLRDNSGTNSYTTTFSAVANTPTKVIITTATLPTTLNVPNSSVAGLIVAVGSLNSGTYSTSTLNAWQSGNFEAANGVTNWGSTASNFIALTELQLEAGPVATTFERESYAVTLAKCQRYYYVGNAPAMVSAGNGTYGGCIVTCYYKVSMRTSPTVTPTATTGTATGGLTLVSTSADAAYISFASAQSSGLYYNAPTVSASAEL